MENFGQNTDQSFGGFGGGMTNAPEQQQPSGFASWGGDMFSTIGTLGTAYFNSQAGYPTGTNYQQPGGFYDDYMPKNNTIIYVVVGVAVLVVLFIFFKKS